MKIEEYINFRLLSLIIRHSIDSYCPSGPFYFYPVSNTKVFN